MFSIGVCVVCDDEHTRGGGGGGGARRAHTTFGSGGAICHVSQPAPAVPNNKTCAHVCERNTRSRTRAERFHTKTTTKQHCALIACYGSNYARNLTGVGRPRRTAVVVCSSTHYQLTTAAAA